MSAVASGDAEVGVGAADKAISHRDVPYVGVESHSSTTKRAGPRRDPRRLVTEPTSVIRFTMTRPDLGPHIGTRCINGVMTHGSGPTGGTASPACNRRSVASGPPHPRQPRRRSVSNAGR